MRRGYAPTGRAPEPVGNRWPSSDTRERLRQLGDEAKRADEQHLAEHGPHVCTPNPADPWSTCHLNTKEPTP